MDTIQMPKLAEPRDAAAIIANCKAIGPIIDEEAPEMDRIGYLTPRMKEVLVAAGCFRMCFPARLGGPALGFCDQVKVIEVLARRDGSVAWNVKILSDSGYYACRLSDEAYRVLYPSIDAATAGALAPIGRADVIGDEFEVTGLWHYGSGVRSADQIVGGVQVYENGEMRRLPNGSPVVLYVYLPVSKVVIQDNWHVTGMRGSGSNSYGVEKVRVPVNHSFLRSAPANAEAEPLIRHVELPFFNTIGTTLGLTAHALDVAKAKISAGKEPAAKQETTQRLYGEAWCCLDAARAHAYHVAESLDEILFRSGSLLDNEAFARMVSAPTTVARLCKRVVELAVEMNGAISIYEDNEMERIVRDVHTNALHIANTPRKWVDVTVRTLVSTLS